MLQPALSTEAQGTKSQQYNCFIILKGNASERACPHTHTQARGQLTIPKQL